jgi:hypothetical protein
VDLFVAMQPKNFNNHSWYKQALAGLHKYQQQRQYREKEEKERIRAPILAEMRDAVHELKKHSGGRVLILPYLSMYWALNSTLQFK